MTKNVERPKWFEREFPSGLPLDIVPNLIDRLRQGPSLYRETLRGTTPAILTVRHDEKWSIQENVGHILDLEPLWLGRVRDLINGEAELRTTDITNTKTNEANHNQANIEDILRRFILARSELVTLIGSLYHRVLERTALHPRLKTPMNVVDLAHFVAEHDAHHLCRIQYLVDLMRTKQG